MTGRVAIQAMDAALFAPFGTVVRAPDAPGGRAQYGHHIAPRPGLALQFHMNAVAPSPLPLRLSQVERHPHAAQVFLPVDVGRYLVTVMAAQSGGSPDPAQTLCFLMPGTLGVIYHPGVWHAGATVLDKTGHFAVLMQRGAADDDVLADIAPLTLTEGAA